MDKIEALAEELDEIDKKYRDILQNRNDPAWNAIVRKKDLTVERIDKLLPTVPDSFPLSRYLLSSSRGHQTVAVEWIRLNKDPFHLNVICYMLLNSPSAFVEYYVLHTLCSIMDQCDYLQLCQIEQTLRSYSPAEETARDKMKVKLLRTLVPQIEFSVCNIVKGSYWWRDVESKFFNSLSGIAQFRLSALQIIRNKKLFDQFTHYRESLRGDTQTLFVYHGSSHDSLQRIAETGFLEPDKLAAMSGHIKLLDPGYFGRGIYQGFAADYAIHYAECYKESHEIMLSMVLPGRSYTVSKGGEKYGKPCEPGFASHISPEEKEIVLFKSQQLLPLFIIQFERIPNAAIVEEHYS